MILKELLLNPQASGFSLSKENLAAPAWQGKGQKRELIKRKNREGKRRAWSGWKLRAKRTVGSFGISVDPAKFADPEESACSMLWETFK